MAAGRKPKPTAVKERDGNPGKRKLNTNEPKLDIKVPTCPTYLTGEAKKEWHRVGKLLASMKVITEADRSALAAYCQVYARWIEAEANVAKVGMIMRSPSGYPIQNPYLGIANTSIKQMQSLLAEFGMTPSSRSRIQVAEEEEATIVEILTRD